MHCARPVSIASVLFCLALPSGAAEIPCRPCAGLRLEPPAPAGPADVARVLKASAGLKEDSPLFVAWEVPLGSTRDLVPIPLGLELGVPNQGGPIMTATGLVFIAAAMDDYLRAFSSETGEELWRGRLPAGGQATPMTYRVREDGRQYVVIAAGGHAIMRTKLGDAVVAFALP